MRTLTYFYHAAILLVIYSCNHTPKTLVVAHRGGADLAPENTIAAFEQAMKLGVDMIEIDIEQTRDSMVVVLHDRKVDRTTDGTGAVDSLTYAQIKDLDAGSWFDDQFTGERIPTLQQVLELINGRVKLLIEIKEGSVRYPGIEQRTVDHIHAHNAKNWVVVQSFNLEAVQRIKAIDPSITTYYLLGSNFDEFFANRWSEGTKIVVADQAYDGLAVHHGALNTASIEMIKSVGWEIYTWTVNDPDQMQRLIGAGVSGIITDRPDILLEVLDR